jgi:hypothetical protein
VLHCVVTGNPYLFHYFHIPIYSKSIFEVDIVPAVSSMTDSKIEVFVLLLLILVERHTQLTAVVTPRGYNASLDPEASFTFQCDVTGTDNIQWLVDGSPSNTQDNRDRGISGSSIITVDQATDSFRSSLSILRNITNRNTTVICLANVLSSTGVSSVASEPVLFKIQASLHCVCCQCSRRGRS